MALLRNLTGRSCVLAQLCRSSSPALGTRVGCAGFATGRSSDEEEGPSSSDRDAKDEQEPEDAAYSQGRADLRSWVDSVLSTLEPKGEKSEHAFASADEGEVLPTSTSEPGSSEAPVDSAASSIDPSTPAESSDSDPPRPSGLEAALARAQTGEPSAPPEAEPAPKQSLRQPLRLIKDTGSEVPRRTTVRELPAAALPDSVVGYQELGVGDVQDGPALLDQGSGRINSLRTFWPGQLYDPDDLVSVSTSYIQQKPWMKGMAKAKKATNSEATAQADFRNVGFLHRFTSEAGQLPPRRVTRLQNKVHKHVMRQIKIARQMALLPPDGKLPELMLAAQQTSPFSRPPPPPPSQGNSERPPQRSTWPQRTPSAFERPHRPAAGSDRRQRSDPGALQRPGLRPGQSSKGERPQQLPPRPPLRAKRVERPPGTAARP